MEHIYLSHHGIKGQKWGVRRFQLKNGRLTTAGKKRYSEDDDEQKKKAEEESAPKKKSISEMTDQELTRAIERAKLEAAYRQYFEPAQKPKVDAGQKFVQAAQDVLKKQVVDPALSTVSKSINSAIDKKISAKLGVKAKSFNDLLKTDVSKLSPEELQKVVDYNRNLKTYREQQEYNSVDAGVERMRQERMDKRSRDLDMQKKELNVRAQRVAVEKAEEERRKAREAAADIVKDVVKDVASDVVSSQMTRSQERAKAVVDQYFDEPLMLPKPDDDLKHSGILKHHGIKGQKWGVRRFQKKDGTLTSTGKKRRFTYDARLEKKLEKYDSEHPERSKHDNYTIALRKEARIQNNRYARTQRKFRTGSIALVTMELASGNVIGAGATAAAVAMVGAGADYVYKKRDMKLSQMYDEYNIEFAKRVINM